MCGIKSHLDGLEISQLKPKPDVRGSFTEVYRKKWINKFTPIQWNVVLSKKGTVRGMRVHNKHTDYVVLFKGKAIYVLKDLRKKSKTYFENCYVKLDSKKMKSVVIHPGIAHGFYFYEDSGYVYGVDHYYSNSDELRFNFRDKECKFKWPSNKIVITKRDKNLPPLKSIINKLTS